MYFILVWNTTSLSCVLTVNKFLRHQVHISTMVWAVPHSINVLVAQICVVAVVEAIVFLDSTVVAVDVVDHVDVVAAEVVVLV